jgi:hypothetical protein
MEVNLAVVIDCDLFSAHGFCKISPDSTSTVDEYTSIAAMNVIYRESPLGKVNGALEVIVSICQGLTVYDFKKSRFVDAKRSFIEECIDKDAVLIVTKETDEEVIKKMIRQATPIETLAMEIRNGN